MICFGKKLIYKWPIAKKQYPYLYLRQAFVGKACNCTRMLLRTPAAFEECKISHAFFWFQERNSLSMIGFVGF